MRDGWAGCHNKKRSRLCHHDRWRPEAGLTLPMARICVARRASRSVRAPRDC